ncbi:hypothetical protein JHK87_027692 [Glycine soja]|nr:hypothetical protein JHK87_027692 [Glycine soja]
MPYPQDSNLTSYLQNSLVLSELDYNHDATRSEFKHLYEIPDHKATLNHAIQSSFSQ